MEQSKWNRYLDDHQIEVASKSWNTLEGMLDRHEEKRYLLNLSTTNARLAVASVAAIIFAFSSILFQVNDSLTKAQAFRAEKIKIISPSTPVPFAGADIYTPGRAVPEGFDKAEFLPSKS